MRNAFILLPILAATAFPAGATLGGSAESVVTDQSKLHAKRAVVDRQDYTVHEIISDDGTVSASMLRPPAKYLASPGLDRRSPI